MCLSFAKSLDLSTVFVNVFSKEENQTIKAEKSLEKATPLNYRCLLKAKAALYDLLVNICSFKTLLISELVPFKIINYLLEDSSS